MPEHLKLETGTIDLDGMTVKDESKRERVSSMPPRLRKRTPPKLKTIGCSDDLPEDEPV